MTIAKYCTLWSVWVLAATATLAIGGDTDEVSTTRPAEELPSAEAVLERFVEVTGGREAWEKCKNRTLEGTLDFVGMGLKAKVKILEAKPRYAHVVLDIAGTGKVEEGCNSNIAWTRSLMNGPHIAEGEEEAFRMRMATFNDHLHWRDVYKTVECVGIETIAENPCYKLVLTPEVGPADICYYDKETGLRVRWDFSVPSMMGTLPMKIYQEDYREIDGIKLPYRSVQHLLGQKRVMTISSIKHNVQLPEDCFALPEDIDALLRKQQQQTVITNDATPAQGKPSADR